MTFNPSKPPNIGEVKLSYPASRTAEYPPLIAVTERPLTRLPVAAVLLFQYAVAELEVETSSSENTQVGASVFCRPAGKDRRYPDQPLSNLTFPVLFKFCADWAPKKASLGLANDPAEADVRVDKEG